jgi:hypothetical protein
MGNLTDMSKSTFWRSSSTLSSPDIHNLNLSYPSSVLVFLDVSNNFISATIPTELGLLTDLQYINLSKNNFVGTIPIELGKLQVLGKWKLSPNHTFLMFPVYILIALFFIPSENFFLEDNSFHGSMPSAICLLPTLHRLEELHADCISPYYERIFCDPPKARILCDCCTYCY